MRPWARRAARSSGGELRVGRRLVAGRAQRSLERERGGGERRGAAGCGARRRGRRGRGGLRLAPLQAREAGEQVAARAVAGRVGVEHDAAAERVGGRERADHEAVAARRDERLLEAQLEVAAAELRQPRGGLARAVVDGDARPAVRAAVGRRPVERDVDAVAGRGRGRGRHDHVPARDLVARHPGQVQRDALARLRPLARLVVDLDGADAGGRARGQDQHLVAARGGARPQRAGDDGAGAADRERAVDVQAQRAAGALVAARRPLAARSSAARSASMPSPDGRRHRHHLGARQQLRRLGRRRARGRRGRPS